MRWDNAVARCARSNLSLHTRTVTLCCAVMALTCSDTEHGPLARSPSLALASRRYSHGPLNQMRGAVRGSSETIPGEGEAEHHSWWPLGSSQVRTNPPLTRAYT